MTKTLSVSEEMIERPRRMRSNRPHRTGNSCQGRGRMSDWQPIESAPRDGSLVYVKRVYERRIIKEDWAVFASLADTAPMRQWTDGGLYGDIPPDHDSANKPDWCNADRLHRFPSPTHWDRSQSKQMDKGEK